MGPPGHDEEMTGHPAMVAARRAHARHTETATTSTEDGHSDAMVPTLHREHPDPIATRMPKGYVELPVQYSSTD